MQLTSIPHVPKHEIDSGQKGGYYATILSDQKWLQSMERKVQQSSLQAPVLPAQEVILLSTKNVQGLNRT